MNQAKYIGMDVHQATISVAVIDSAGKLILESILETKAATILEFLGGLRGSLLVTFEEGTSAPGDREVSHEAGHVHQGSREWSRRARWIQAESPQNERQHRPGGQILP